MTGAIWSQYQLNQREDVSETARIKEELEFSVLTCGELGQILYLLESLYLCRMDSVKSTLWACGKRRCA